MATSAFTIKGISRLQAWLTPAKMTPALDKNIRRATGQNALFVLAQIRKGIRAGGYAKNADLTQAIKGSGKPLVDHGELFKAITKKIVDSRTAFVGILKTDEAFNIGLIVHEGATVKVSDRMRAMFFLLWLASKGQIPAGDLKGRARELFDRYKDWKPIAQSTTAIRIPPRPFIKDVWDKPIVKRTVLVNWKNAVGKTYKDMK